MGSDSKRESNAAEEELEIPPEAMELVQHLKEVVDKNCTHSEIYAVLMECNMDPNEAVARLLAQDSFKPVKNKRDRRKEMKEKQQSRARFNSGTANRGVRFGSERAAGRTGATENNYNELGKTAYKREMISAAPSVPSSSSCMYRATGKVINEQPSAHSKFLNADDRRQSIGTGDTIFPSVQSSSGFQPTQPGVSKGHVSLADIVRRGTPQNKGSQMPSEISCTSQPAVFPNSPHYHDQFPQSSPESELHQDPYSSQPYSFPEMIHGSSMTDAQHDLDNECPVIEHLPVATGSLVRCSQSDDFQIPERDFESQNQSSEGSLFASSSGRQIFANNDGRVSDDDLLKEARSYESHGHVSKHPEGIGNVSHLSFRNSSASLNDDAVSVSSAMASLQQLNIGKEEPVMPPTEDHSAVVLPSHFQALVTDCSHLSFGTYTSGIASSSPMAVASDSTESNLEVSVGDGSSTVYPSFRHSQGSYDDQRGFMYDTQRVTADARNYDPPVSSQTKPMKQDFPEATCGHQYISPSSVPDSSTRNNQQSDSNFPFVLDSNARSLPSVVGESRSEPTPSDSLESLHQSLEMTNPSPFLETQLMPAGYATAVSSVNNHTVPMPEVLNSGSFLPRLSPEALPGSNLANRIVLPQRQRVHPYSQPTRPSNNFTHMIAYPSMAQTQAYVPSAFRQAYLERSRFHDARARMNYNLSHYRSIDPMGSLPLSYNRPSPNGNFVGRSSNIPGSFPRNQSPSLIGSAVGHDGGHSVYGDGNRFTPRQQWYENNPSSSIRDLGGNPQRMSIRTDSAYYRLLGQNQHRVRYQHDQQASQHYESPRYPNAYDSEMLPTSRSW